MEKESFVRMWREMEGGESLSIYLTGIISSGEQEGGGGGEEGDDGGGEANLDTDLLRFSGCTVCSQQTQSEFTVAETQTVRS